MGKYLLHYVSFQRYFTEMHPYNCECSIYLNRMVPSRPISSHLCYNMPNDMVRQYTELYLLFLNYCISDLQTMLIWANNKVLRSRLAKAMRKAGELKNLYEILKIQKNDRNQQAVEKMIRQAEDSDNFFYRVRGLWEEFDKYPPRGWRERNYGNYRH